jgi:hypothetical protein
MSMFLKESFMSIMVKESFVNFLGGAKGEAAVELATNVKGGPEGMSKFFKESCKV